MKLPGLKRGFLSVLIWILVAVHKTSCKCSEGRDVFLLTMNYVGDTTPYQTIMGPNLTECVAFCREDENCKSVVFFKNATETHCDLMDLAKKSKIEDEMLKESSGLYHFEKICLSGACDRLFVMERLRKVELEGHDNLVLNNLTLTGCMQSCLSERSFVCRSSEFDETTGQCRLSRYDRFSRHTHFRPSASPSVSYFDNICAFKPVSGSTTAEIMLLGNVEHPYSLLEYQGVSVSECGDLCLRNSLFPCRSFLFGRRSGRPFCGLTHQNRAGLLQTPGSFKPSSSLNYYEIARNLDACDGDEVHFELHSGQVLDVNPYKVATDLTSQECLTLCRAEVMCRSVNIDYRKGTCQFNADNLRSGPNAVLREFLSFNYFEKTCLPGGSVCKRDWAFERVRGKELVGFDHDRVSVEANTREECQAACLLHKDFVCRSAHFNYQLHECRISTFNRHSFFSKKKTLEDSRVVVDYFENNCVKEARSFCNNKSFKKQALAMADRVLRSDSVESCLEECYKTSDFICRTSSFETSTRLCFLGHHTRKSAPDGAIVRSETSELREVSSCFDVSVDCGQDVMKARVTTNKIFNGKVYTKSDPTGCAVDISGSMKFTLPILLKGCGSENEEEGKFSNVLVIQSNDQVVTATDKAVGVYCSYDIGNRTEEARLNITNINSTDQSRSSPSLPDVSMHILDARGKEKESVSLGELLRVQVRMSEEDTYGIFVRNLVARDGTGANNLTLIDNTGCPVEVKMMREIRTLNPKSKSLESYLEAFTFTGSTVLELEAEVETCRENCKPILCQIPTGRSEDDLETVSSFGRRRRRDADVSVLTTKTLTKSLTVQASEFGLGGSNADGNYAVPVTAPSTSFKDKFSSRDNVNADEDDVICFEPIISAVVGGSVLFSEIFVFVLCLILSCKLRHQNQGKEATPTLSIYYPNISDLGST